ncbi:hypothetical protein ACFVP0_03655 [Streptomyces cinereoruber]|uniref:hypothetical protein n=1 Tax=Streptomyces cinereoruber TaxID=67260 RepID=UPI0036ADF466
MRKNITAGLVAAATLALTLTACGTTPEPDRPAAAPAPVTTAPSLSPEARDSAQAAAGLPPEPTAEARQAYLDALNAIDTRIVKPGKEDQAVSRGINQCGSIKGTKDENKLAQTALDRFTVTTRLPDIATPETGKKITKAVHTHLCPDF